MEVENNAKKYSNQNNIYYVDEVKHAVSVFVETLKIYLKLNLMVISIILIN